MGRMGSRRTLFFLLVVAALLLLALQLQEAQGRRTYDHLTGNNNDDDGMRNYACDYHIEVKTGDVEYAGTDSKITFELYRQDGSGWRTKVDSSGTFYGNIFEQGSLDTLDRNMWCMHPCKLTLRSNGAGFFPDWYLEWVRVTVSGDISDQQTFYLNDWIGPYSPHGSQATIDHCHHNNRT